MKVSNYMIYNFFSENDGESIALKLLNANLSATASYKRMKNLKMLSEVFKDIIETNNNLVKEYGHLDEKNENWTLDGETVENKQKFTSGFNEVLKIEEEVNIRKFDMYELDGRIDFTSKDFAGMIFMINVPDEDEDKKEDEVSEDLN